MKESESSSPELTGREDLGLPSRDPLPTAQAKLSAFLEYTTDSIFIVDRKLRFVTFNLRFAQEFRHAYGSEPRVGIDAVYLLPGHTKQLWLELFQRTLAGEVLAFQFHEDSGASRRHYDVRLTPVRTGGSVVGATVISREITARIEAEEALRASEARLSAIFDNTDDALWSVDTSYRLVAFNRIFGERVCEGEGHAVVVGETATFPAPEPEMWRPLYDRALAGERFTHEYACGQGLRTTFYEVSLGPIEVDGEIKGACMQARDVTAKRRAEEALRRTEQRLHFADRMITVGTLAAGVAHEINNPLAFMFANLEYLERLVSTLPPGVEEETRQRLRGIVRVVEDGAGRIRDIVRDLGALSRPSEDGTLPRVDVHDVLELSLTMAQVALRHRASIVKSFGPLPPVRANPSRLGQVFLNLLVNAAQAIPEGAADTNRIVVSTSTDEFGRATVDIADTGCGIPEELRERIFDPFFTTKPVGMGTGLGLSICHGIVTGIGGELTVRSEVGKGSTFRVALAPSTSTP